MFREIFAISFISSTIIFVIIRIVLLFFFVTFFFFSIDLLVTLCSAKTPLETLNYPMISFKQFEIYFSRGRVIFHDLVKVAQLAGRAVQRHGGTRRLTRRKTSRTSKQRALGREREGRASLGRDQMKGSLKGTSMTHRIVLRERMLKSRISLMTKRGE